MKKFLVVAKFEYLKIASKKSFWFSTLFFPLFMAFVMFISGYSSMDSQKKMEDKGSFSKIYIVDEAGMFPDEMYVEPVIKAESVESVKDDVVKDTESLLISIPSTFLSDLNYELYFNGEGSMFTNTMATTVTESMFRNFAMSSIPDENISKMITGPYSATTYVYDSKGNLEKFGIEEFILPVISLIVFFLSVFISSSFMLDSVSAEKENRMIETMLSMVDKKSLMFGKMIGLMGVALTQLLVWVGLGLAAYFGINNYLDLKLPFEINWSNIDWNLLPLNIFLTVCGFVFFASVMIGVGAVGAGAEDSRSLSSVFIILSIFPMYLLETLMTQPDSLIAKVFSYFPFTSFMTLLLRNSFGSLSSIELGFGILISILYTVVALFLSMKLFELGCLMYNRRPTWKEIVGYLK